MSIDCELFVFDNGTSERRRVRVEAEDDDLVSDLIQQLKLVLPIDLPWYLDGRPVDSRLLVGALGLVDGAFLSAGVPIPSARHLRLGKLELRTVGGLGAGRSFPLVEGAHVIGRGVPADLRIVDREVSVEHARLDIRADGTATVTDLRSTNGTTVEGVVIIETTSLAVGDRFQVGSTLLELAEGGIEALQVVPGPGHLGVNRRFRGALPSWPSEIPFPRPLEEREIPPLNLLLTLAPGVAMIGIALATGHLEFLALAALSPLIGIGRAFTQRRGWKRKRVTDADKFDDEMVSSNAELAAACRSERVGRRAVAPDLAELAVHARLPGPRLWERQPADPDFLRVRVGSATQPSTIKVTGREGMSVPDAWSVPVEISLPKSRNLSLLGPLDRLRPIAAGIVLQLAIRHAPTDLKIVVIATEKEGRDWGWVGWLPHCRWASDEPFVLVGSDQASVNSRLAELRALVKQRLARLAERQRAAFLPSVVVIIDDASRVIAQGFAEILRDGPQVGVFAICLDEVQVPEQCQASLRLPGSVDSATLQRRDEHPIPDITVDVPASSFCEIVACALAPLRALGVAVANGELPASLRLLDLLGMAKLTPEAIVERWQRVGASSGAVIGVAPEGPLEIDLIRHGPHGLVAGTTRAGKTEMIKTLVASFALANHPDDLSFLYIDFKGGRDYQIAMRLPHAVDLSTSEDIEDFERTLRLLEGELGRRRRLFTQAETSTIEGYSTARRARRDLGPMSRLLVIVDEFAELVEKAPDQLQRLVSVARTGAAFGVHLILATQRPSGVVTGQIDSNVALRICFRVAKKEDGIEVIGSPQPAEIAERHRGRGFMYAHQPPLTEFQCARVGGARPGSQSERVELKASLRLWHEIGRVPPADNRVEVPDPETDFWDVFKALDAATRLTGWTTSAVPWPKPLPTSASLEELPSPADPLLVPFVMVDDPLNQSRRSDGLLLGSGHVAVVGSSGTGRTTALRSVACSLAARFTAADAHIYLLDFAGGGLRPLIDLPHCGGTAFEDWDQMSRIVRELDQTVKARLEEFSQKGFARLDDQRRSGGQPMPYIVVLLDGWEVVADEGVRYGLTEKMTQLLAKGQSVGLQAVVAGDRTALLGRIGRLIGARYLLRFNDPNDFVAAGLNFRDIPSSQPPGRVVIVGSNAEGQVALLPDPAEEGDVAVTRRFVAAMRQRDSKVQARWPRRIEPLPQSISLKDAVERGSPPDSMQIPVLLGLSGETGRPVFFDLGVATAFVGGPAESGRTTALRSIGEFLLSRKVPIAIVNPRRSTLSSLASRPGVTAVFEGPAARQLDMSSLAALAKVVLIDDFDQLDSTNEGLLALVSGKAGLGVVAAGPSDMLVNGSSGWLAAMKRARTGLLLSPKSKFDGAVFGGTLPEHMVFQGPRGRAVAGVAGRIDVVQIPLP